MADWLTNLYQQYTGRAPDASGQSYWQNLANTGTSQADIAAGIQASPEGQSYASGGASGGGSGDSIDSSAFDAKSSSFGGLPTDTQNSVTGALSGTIYPMLSNVQWNASNPFNGAVQSAIQNLQNNPYMGDMMNAYNSYAQNTPGQIEALRQAQGSQYLAGMKPMQQLYQPAMDSMAKRGIVNSSITGDALSKVQDQVNQGYEQAMAGANTQAAQNLLGFQANLPQMASSLAGIYGTQSAAPGNMALAQQGANTSAQSLFANTINSLLNAARYSQSQSTQPSSAIASYLFGGS